MDKVLSGRGTGGRYKRPNFPTEFKRQLAEQALEPGASVALIARRNDVNANMVFKWRNQYREGAYGLPSAASGAPIAAKNPAPMLLPVAIVEDVPASSNAATAPAATTGSESGICEIDFEHACLRIRGDVSPALLRLLIRELSRAPEAAR